MPQGLPWSPLLSLLMMSYMVKRVGIDETKLVMYADDGLVICKSRSELESIIKKLNSPAMQGAGILMTDKVKKDGRPACGLVTGELKFLGMTYNLKDETVLMRNKFEN